MVIVKEGMSDWPGNDGEMTSRSNSRLTFEGIKVRDFFEKNMKKKHLSMIRIIITFANQIFL